MFKLLHTIGDVATDEFLLDKPQINIGRSADNDMSLDDPLVSSRHAIVTITASAYTGTSSVTLQDMNSTNGTRVNGKTTQQAQLKHGDLIQFGRSVFRFHDDSARSPTASQN